MEIADKKKILLIDDHPLLRKGIGMIIRQKLGQYHQIGEAANSQEAYSMVLSDDWDVVVLDINIPGRDGIDLLKDFHRDKPDLPILMLSAYPIKEFAIRCIKAGASGYINKQSPADDIAEAIAHSDSVLSEGRSTYLDRRTAGLARALSYARSGNRAAMEQAFRAALMGVDATESVMSQAVVRLARAVAYETMGDVNADAYRLEASSLLADMGVAVPGWERAFRIASGDIRSANIST